MMNKLYIGLAKTVELPKGGLLLIEDDARDVQEWRRPRVFGPLNHSFDPLKGIDDRMAVALVDAVMAVMPGGETTLTKEDAEYILLEALLSKPRSLERLIEKSKDPARARRMIGRLLLSPVIKRVLCGKTNFTFNQNSVNMARINRAELGDFDALVLGLLLMGHFKGQLVVPDLGFYGRDAHVSLVREERLIGGINFLAELPDKLRKGVLLMQEREASGATVEDAEVLAARYEQLVPGTNGFRDFVADAIE